MRARRENAKPRLWKRALACVVSAAMVVAFTPVVAWGGTSTETVTYRYCDENGANWTTGTKSAVDYTVVGSHSGSGSVTWSTGWYLAQGDVTITNTDTSGYRRGVTVSGDVHLILADGCNLTVNGGIQVQDNSAESVPNTNSLTIYAQSTGDNIGKLIARDVTGGNAGIGGNTQCSGGAITINGGVVTATGGGDGAGIGGGTNGVGGNITIKGGTVTATGNGGGAGIGGGQGVDIGGGQGGLGGSGTFKTQEKDATVAGNAVIFASSIAHQGNKNSWSGVIFEGTSGSVYGNPILLSDLAFPGANGTATASAKNLTVPLNNTLTISENVTLTIADDGTLNNDGTIINKGTIIGTVSGNPLLIPTEYANANGAQQQANAIEITESYNPTSWSSGWYVAKGAVAINNCVEVTGNVHLILADGCNLTVNGGIKVQDNDTNPNNTSANSLSIYAQSTGARMGKLNANGAENGAGIGGSNNAVCEGNCGSITINGGEIKAQGGSSGGAGIGGAYGGQNDSGGSGGCITINGGAVTATSIKGAGIGGGYAGERGGAGGVVTITGGIVEATSTNGAGIGGGTNGSSNINTDGSTFSTGTNGNAVVFASSIGDQDSKNSWSGVIFQGVEYTAGAFSISRDSGIDPAVTINNGLVLNIGDSLTIGSNAAVVVPSEKTLTNNGTITNKGKIFIDGALDDNATGAIGGDVFYPLILEKASVDASASGNTSTFNNTTYGKAGSEITLAPIAQTGYTFGGWEVSPADAATVSESNSFQMPAQSVTITARWTAIYVPSTPAPDPVPEVGESTTGIEIPSAPAAPGGTGSTTGGSGGSTTVDITVTDNTATTDSQGNKVDGTVSVGNIESTAESVAIPETITTGGGTFLVTEIPAGAMAENSTATTVTIPDSVTSIGAGAFQNCTELTSVSVPSGVTTIEQSTFAGCTSLQSVEIKGEATEIASNAFAGCTSLESVEIPASVTTIGEGAFAGCESLTSVTIPAGATVGDGAFAGCTKLTSVTIPPDATIGENAFAGTGVTQVTIASSATVGEKAFANSSLTQVKISGSASVGRRAFQGCEDLTKATLGKGLKSLPAYMFKGCTNLTSVTVPSTVTKLERSVFSGCDSLKSVKLPKSVKSIGKNAFYGADKVKKLTVSSTQLTKKSVVDCLKGSSVTTVYVPKSKLAAYKSLFSKQNCGKKVTLKPIG